MKKLFLFPLILVLTLCFCSLHTSAIGPVKPPRFASRAYAKKKVQLQQTSTLLGAEGMPNQLKRSEKPELSFHNSSANVLLHHNTQQLLSPILNDKHLLSNLSVTPALERMWNLEKYTNDNYLFLSLVSKYYAQNFGVISPHMATLFGKINSLQNRDLEARFLQRMMYLARNRELLSQNTLSPSVLAHLTQKSFRLRYLSDIRKLNAKNFEPDQLVLSIEKRMSPNPNGDLPLGHINGRSLLYGI